MKYLDYAVTFSEFPNEIALCINITNCPFHCPGCHSPELWEDIGTELTEEELSKLIESNKGISCVGFMGGIPKKISELAEFIKTRWKKLKVGWYWGGEKIPEKLDEEYIDYVKIGPYKQELGGLDNPNTNQRMYYNWYDSEDDVVHSVDITYKFWKHGNK